MDADAAGPLLESFLASAADRPTLGLVYGRRRIGKSTLLFDLVRRTGGFYWEATRGEAPIHLQRLGAALGEHLGIGRLSFDGWEDALHQLLRVGESGPVPVVLDELGYLLEADPTLDSIVAAALGPGGRERSGGRARLILCGSAIALMRSLTAGEAALRGRAGLELVMQPLDHRAAARHLPSRNHRLALAVYSVIGGVIGYYTDMVDHDLPESGDEFGGWVCARVLSPAATLSHEATTLLAEDPTLASGSASVHHSILGAIANGSVTAGKIANRLRRPVSNLDPALKRLVAAGFVVRHEDPIRAQRPTYALADPFLQFHFAVLEPHGPILRERDPRSLWDGRLSATFDSLVRGPVFEELGRSWARRQAEPDVFGGVLPDHLGPSTAVVDGIERQLDVVASASEPGAQPSERTVLAIGEARAGETGDLHHLRALERARVALGTRAAHARLLLFAPDFSGELMREADRRSDVELVDLDRLYEDEPA